MLWQTSHVGNCHRGSQQKDMNQPQKKARLNQIVNPSDFEIERGIILNDEHSSHFANVREKNLMDVKPWKVIQLCPKTPILPLRYLTPISHFKSMILCSFQMKDSFISRRKLPKNPSPTSGIFLGPPKKLANKILNLLPVLTWRIPWRTDTWFITKGLWWWT